MKIIPILEGNLFVNDIVIKNNNAYISITNIGNIFTLDIADITTLDESRLKEYLASYPADGVTVADNVIYKIQDVSSPQLTKLITREGQYDGLALVGHKLYFTSWVNGEIGYVNLDENNRVTLLNLKDYSFAAPADMTYFDGKICIPNLTKSEMAIIDVQ